MFCVFFPYAFFTLYKINKCTLANISTFVSVCFQLCIKDNLLLHWVWNGKIILSLYKDDDDATKLSLEYLFDNGSDINTIFNTKYVKNQTLFNMITQNKTMTDADKLKILIDYKFKFEKLINVCDNVKHKNGLLQLCSYSSGSYNLVKMLFDHCNTIKNCKIDITHCDVKKQNALFYSAINDINTLKHLLSNKCFPNHDEMDDKNIQIALKQTNVYGNTIAHVAVTNATPHIVDTFKLLKKYNFNFNIYDHYGYLPIHIACINNCVSLLSWMIDATVFDINCKTKYARNKNQNGFSTLFLAVYRNSIECVDVLCKQTKDIHIATKTIYRALDNDNVTILK